MPDTRGRGKRKAFVGSRLAGTASPRRLLVPLASKQAVAPGFLLTAAHLGGKLVVTVADRRSAAGWQALADEEGSWVVQEDDSLVKTPPRWMSEDARAQLWNCASRSRQ